jgi:hypothetical protein
MCGASSIMSNFLVEIFSVVEGILYSQLFDNLLLTLKL